MAADPLAYRGLRRPGVDYQGPVPYPIQHGGQCFHNLVDGDADYHQVGFRQVGIRTGCIDNARFPGHFQVGFTAVHPEDSDPSPFRVADIQGHGTPDESNAYDYYFHSLS